MNYSLIVFWQQRMSGRTGSQVPTIVYSIYVTRPVSHAHTHTCTHKLNPTYSHLCKKRRRKTQKQRERRWDKLSERESSRSTQLQTVKNYNHIIIIKALMMMTVGLKKMPVILVVCMLLFSSLDVLAQNQSKFVNSLFYLLYFSPPLSVLCISILVCFSCYFTTY